jgi:ABC-type sulfate transport system permease component
VLRAVVAGVLLLLELPLLLPVIVGGVVMAVIAGARGVKDRVNRGQRRHGA